MGEMREFVYLDDVSLNSNLSSLGRGIPSEIVQSSEGESEKTGEGGATIMGYGLKGKYSGIDRNAIETTLKISSPYRFQDLLDSMEEAGIDRYENPDPRSLKRGDVVKITGTAKPMSLFKFEVALETILQLVNNETKETLEEVDDNADIEEDVQVGELEAISDLIENFTGNKIPIRMDTSDYSFGVALDREKMRVSSQRAFLDEKQYTLFGRVDRRIVGDDSWDPILATSVIKRYMPESDVGEEMRENLEQVAEEMSIPTEKDDWELTSHTAVIEPIALYW